MHPKENQQHFSLTLQQHSWLKRQWIRTVFKYTWSTQAWLVAECVLQGEIGVGKGCEIKIKFTKVNTEHLHTNNTEKALKINTLTKALENTRFSYLALLKSCKWASDAGSSHSVIWLLKIVQWTLYKCPGFKNTTTRTSLQSTYRESPMTRCSHTVSKTQGANQAEPQGPILAHSGSAVLAEIGSLLLALYYYLNSK